MRWDHQTAGRNFNEKQNIANNEDWTIRTSIKVFAINDDYFPKWNYHRSFFFIFSSSRLLGITIFISFNRIWKCIYDKMEWKCEWLIFSGSINSSLLAVQSIIYNVLCNVYMPWCTEIIFWIQYHRDRGRERGKIWTVKTWMSKSNVSIVISQYNLPDYHHWWWRMIQNKTKVNLTIYVHRHICVSMNYMKVDSKIATNQTKERREKKKHRNSVLKTHLKYRRR